MDDNTNINGIVLIPLVFLTLRVLRLSFQMSLKACLRASSISHLRLMKRMIRLEASLEPSEADDSTELAPSGATFQSEADAEMVAMLALAAKSIKLERTPPQCPEHSRLDDFFWVLSMTLNRTQPQFLSS